MTDELTPPSARHDPARPTRVVVTFEEAERETAARPFRWLAEENPESHHWAQARAFLAPRKQAVYDAAHERALTELPLDSDVGTPAVRDNEFLQIRDPLARAIRGIIQEQQLFRQRRSGFVGRHVPDLPSSARSTRVRQERVATVGFVRRLCADGRVDEATALDILAEGLDDLGDRTIPEGDPDVYVPATQRKGFFGYYELLNSLNDGMRARLNELAAAFTAELDRFVAAARNDPPPGGFAGGQAPGRR